MTCHSLAEALTDAASGRDVGRGTAAAIETHLEGCESCRARFVAEQRLSEGLHALAAAVAGREASPSVEARVMELFAERGAAASRRVIGIRSWWMQAAAAVLVVAGAAAWRLVERRAPVTDTPGFVRSSDAAPPKAAPPPSDVRAAAQMPQAHQRNVPTVRKPRPSRIVRPEGFQPLPTAAGLPPFESGEIVRVEVPVTSLPVYGIEIPPDPRSSIVKADFLIGQDRVARAIRLVPVDRSGAGARVE
jgi:hypothetical protein